MDLIATIKAFPDYVIGNAISVKWIELLTFDSVITANVSTRMLFAYLMKFVERDEGGGKDDGGRLEEIERATESLKDMR